ncbi:MAG: GDP-mannose 4,6-dehydratase [Acidobacteriota bacterium]
MRILITGGAGFIGSHLAEHLLELGHSVYIIDDLSTGQIENVLHLKPHPRFQCTIESIMNIPVTAELVDLCDVVFHAAAAVGVRLIVESPVRTIETNIRGTEIILQLAAKKRKKVVIFSTSEVYGKASKVPFSEDDDLVLGPTSRGRWSYACSKAIDEFLALAYFREKGLPVAVVRLFNTVGPRQTGRYGMVLPTFARQALESQDLTVFGDGSQSRCFSHVSDIVGALARLVDCEEAIGGVFNIGNDEEITIAGLAEKVIQLSGSPSKIRLIPYDQAYAVGFEDMPRRVPDLSRIRATIGYEPRMDLNSTVRSVVEHYRGRAGNS